MKRTLSEPRTIYADLTAEERILLADWWEGRGEWGVLPVRVRQVLEAGAQRLWDALRRNRPPRFGVLR